MSDAAEKLRQDVERVERLWTKNIVEPATRALRSIEQHLRGLGTFSEGGFVEPETRNDDNTVVFRATPPESDLVHDWEENPDFGFLQCRRCLQITIPRFEPITPRYCLGKIPPRTRVFVEGTLQREARVAMLRDHSRNIHSSTDSGISSDSPDSEDQ